MSKCFAEEEKREPLLEIGEMLYRDEVEEPKLLLQALGVEFAADLDQDAVACRPVKGSSERRKVDFLRRRRDGVHFDLLPFGVVTGLVAYFAQIEVASSEPIDVFENIENELGRESCSVGIGAFQNGGVLYSVGSDQEKIFGSHSLRQQIKETHESRRVEVPDGAAEKDKQLGKFSGYAKKAILITGMQTVKLDFREIFANRIPGIDQAGETYINGRKDAGLTLPNLSPE